MSDVRARRDPIEHVKRLLIDNDLAEAGELKAIEKEIKKEVETAIEKAKGDALPGQEAMFEDVYVATGGASARGTRPGTWHKLT